MTAADTLVYNMYNVYISIIILPQPLYALSVLYRDVLKLTTHQYASIALFLFVVYDARAFYHP